MPSLQSYIRAQTQTNSVTFQPTLTVNTAIRTNRRPRLFASSPSPLPHTPTQTLPPVFPNYVPSSTFNNTPNNTPTEYTSTHPAFQFPPLRQQPINVDLSTLQSALQPLPTMQKSPLPTGNPFSFMNLEQSKSHLNLIKSVKQDRQSALTFIKTFTERISDLSSCIYDSNGELRVFESYQNELVKRGNRVDFDTYAGRDLNGYNVDECIDREGFGESKENSWERGLWEMDVFCVISEIKSLEYVIQELSMVVPLGR